MKPWTRWLYLIAGLAVVFVTVSAIALAVRQHSWEPIGAVGWIPAVIAATLPGTHRRCWPRRRNVAG
jgi:hypothetical protein